MNFPLPQEWTQEGLTKFLSSRSSEDKNFECKASINYSWDLKNTTNAQGNKPFANNPFHSSKAINSYLALRAIESIISFANADGGLLLLGVAESRAKHGGSDCDGFKIQNQSGEVSFIIHGIEADRIGYQKGVFNEDKCIRELKDILFPKFERFFDGDTIQSKPFIYKRRFGENEVKHSKRIFSENYEESLIQEIKLIPFSPSGSESQTVVALVIKVSEQPIYVEVIEDNGILKKGIYVRSAFNHNSFLKDEKMSSYLLNRAKERNGKRIEYLLTESNKPSNPTKSRKELVSPYFRNELENYIIPNIADQLFPNKIYELINQGKNIFILGESGLGKSLLMAHCFLNYASKKFSCYHSIDRTQGPDIYLSAPILTSLRNQIQAIAELNEIKMPFQSGSIKDWVFEREYLEKVLRARKEKQPDEKIAVFLDGLDENYLETRDTEFILNILKPLIIDDSLGIVWVFSSQPRQGMEWINNYFEILAIEGLGVNEAKSLLKQQLPPDLGKDYPDYFNELMGRTKMEANYYDPEMLVLLGRAVSEKFKDGAGKLRFISKKALKSYMGVLPLGYREKYHWLFERYTNDVKLKDVPSLKENAETWEKHITSYSYTQFLKDILSILCLIRRPVPHDVLAWALELKEKHPKKDFRDREINAFRSYPAEIIEAKNILETAVKDLQRFVKVFDEQKGVYAFCKEIIRENFSKFLQEEEKNSAKSRLGALALEEISLIKKDNLQERPTYLMKELFYLISQDSERMEKSLEKLLWLECLPEWLQEKANREEPPRWVSLFISDLKSIENKSVSKHIRHRLDLFKAVITDWQCQMDSRRNIIAPLIRNERRLGQIWESHLNSILLIPTDGYSRKQGHSAPITSLAVLPDGRIVSGSFDKTIRIWDLKTGSSTILGQYNHYMGTIKLSVLSEHSFASCVAGSWDKKIRIWDLNSEDYEELDEIELPDYLKSYDNDVMLFNNKIAYRSDADIIILNLQTKEKTVLSGHTDYINFLFAANGRYLVLSAANDKQIIIRDMLTGDNRFYKGNLEGAVVSLSDKYLAFSIDENKIRIINLENGKRKFLRGHSDNVNSLAFLANGLLASGSEDNSIRIWDFKKGTSEVLQNYTGTELVTLSDNRFATNGSDNTIKIWDLKNGGVNTLGDRSVGIRIGCVLSDGRMASYCSENTIRIHDFDKGEVISLEGDSHIVNGFVSLPNGRLISYGSDLRIWDLETKKAKVLYPESSLSSLISLKDGRLASYDSNNIVQIWDINKESNTTLFKSGKDDDINSLIELPDGRLAVGFSGKYPIRIFDLITNEVFSLWENPHKLIKMSRLIMLADGRLAAGYCGLIRVWDINKNEVVDLCEDHFQPLFEIEAIPHNRIISLGEGEPLRIWDLKTKSFSTLDGLPDINCSFGGDFAVTYLPDNYLAWCCSEKQIRIFNIDTNKEIAVGFLEGIPKQVFYLPKKQYLIVATSAGLEIFDYKIATK